MTTKPLIKFSIADFERIKNNGFVSPISPETIAIIQALADQVGAPEYIKTPQFIKNEVKEPSSAQGYRKNKNAYANGNNYTYANGNGNTYANGNKSFELNDDAWEAVRNFKATLITKKEGMGAVIDQIRKHLNKMTLKTYDTLKGSIIKEIEGITEGILDHKANIESLAGEDEDFIKEINKIGEALFTIASGNSFYSHMYATLYKELMTHFPFMKTIFETNFRQFNTLFQDFSYCDPNKDYDQFCQNNKVNEKRRALSLFYVNLMKEKLIDAGEIEKIFIQLQNNLLSAIKETDKKNIVDEMVEIIYIIIVNGYEQLKELDNYDAIEEFINTASGFKVNQYPSITNKTIFKFMDILDIL